jgi:hypothetical protein
MRVPEIRSNNRTEWSKDCLCPAAPNGLGIMIFQCQKRYALASAFPERCLESARRVRSLILTNDWIFPVETVNNDRSARFLNPAMCWIVEENGTKSSSQMQRLVKPEGKNP